VKVHNGSWLVLLGNQL